MLSKKVEYALMALLYMDQGGRDAVVSSKEIAEACALPVDLMGKVTQALARGGFIEAIHGSRGGYRITRSLAGVSLGDVIEAIEGPVHLVKCQHDAAECGRYPVCSVREPILKIHARLHSFIHGISLAALKPDAAGVAAGE